MAKSPRSWFSRSFLLGSCDAIIAVSNFAARVMREGAYEPGSPEAERRARPPMRGDRSKIHVIHGGIDTERFRPFEAAARRRDWGLEPEHYALAVAGGYDLPRGKGQREFLEAAALIHQQVPRARFLIIGRGNMADILQADIVRLGLTRKAWLTPYCNNMPEAMNAIDCLVHCQTGTEAFGLVLLEAFACGRPVIASALDGIPEAFAVGGLGKLVKPGSVAELADAMRDRAEQAPVSSDERTALHRKVAAEHSVPAFAGRVLKFYGQLTANGRGQTGRIEARMPGEAREIFLSARASGSYCSAIKIENQPNARGAVRRWNRSGRRGCFD